MTREEFVAAVLSVIAADTGTSVDQLGRDRAAMSDVYASDPGKYSGITKEEIDLLVMGSEDGSVPLPLTEKYYDLDMALYDVYSGR